ncbi:response regulator [Azotosporobacter soli]|uniref:response regulator n=1 Tax=Azotosporobacter soli TaxID=3055040 RepID=UPI0031FF06A3
MINVLIVEDDPMVAEFNKQYVALVEGFQVVAVARSGDEALALLKEHDIDLVLLDIFMPGKTGIELLTAIRLQGLPTDAIVVSAACDQKHILAATRLGAVDYLIKPFEFERLQESLNAYREWATAVTSQPTVRQSDVDQLRQRKEQSFPQQVPKGIDRKTLQTVWHRIKQSGGQSFSTEELANLVGLTRISMRKYLEFIKQLDLLEHEISYGSVGRPIYKYRCLNPNSPLITRYF